MQLQLSLQGMIQPEITTSNTHFACACEMRRRCRVSLPCKAVPGSLIQVILKNRLIWRSDWNGAICSEIAARGQPEERGLGPGYGGIMVLACPAPLPSEVESEPAKPT